MQIDLLAKFGFFLDDGGKVLRVPDGTGCRFELIEGGCQIRLPEGEGVSLIALSGVERIVIETQVVEGAGKVGIDLG